MTSTRNRNTLWTFGMVFAIALGPGLMQADEFNCALPADGDTSLEILNVTLDGNDMIAFAPDVRTYEVMLPEETGIMLIRAESTDPGATVSYNLSDGCAPVAHETLPTGGGLFTLESVPEGHSLLSIWVHAPEGAADVYTVFLAQPEQCQ